MAFLMILQLLLCSQVARAETTTSTTSTSQPSTSTTTSAGNSKVVSSLSSVFSSLTTAAPLPGWLHRNMSGDICDPCWPCNNCEIGAMAKPVKAQLVEAHHVSLAHDEQHPVAIASAAPVSSEVGSVATPAAIFIPYTAQAFPSRTTIYQALSTGSALIDGADTDSILASDKLQHSIKADEKDPADITQDYYTYSLNGRSSSIIPLIVQDNQGAPVSLLSYAKTIFNSNLISADLVEQLNLTHRIDRSSSLPSLAQHGDLEVMSSQIASLSGVLSLDVVAGRNDVPLSSVQFIVFTPATHTDAIKPEYHGTVQPDVYVGIDFLFKAGALGISDDFVGVEPKKGLGIVVQKVFDSIRLPKEQAKKAIFHGEL